MKKVMIKSNLTKIHFISFCKKWLKLKNNIFSAYYENYKGDYDI